MRVMMKIQLPVENGNKGIKDGNLPKTVMGFIETVKPESSYFYAEGGLRTGLFFFDLKDPTKLPSIMEPFFMNLNAGVEVFPVMNAQDLKVGLEQLPKGF